MSYYWDAKFLKHLNPYKIYDVCEVGARFGCESISLANIFVEADIYSFEANPMIIDKTKNRLKNYDRIKFYPFGLGEKEEELPFYPYLNKQDDNIGCSSFLKRIDYDSTQIELKKKVKVRRLDNVMKEEEIDHIDLLCLDVQGFELKVLKGAGERLHDIDFVIMEQPNPNIDLRFLPPNVHSKYINAPNHKEIKDFMNKNNFVEIERIQENYIEDNVMYRNIKCLTT